MPNACRAVATSRRWSFRERGEPCKERERAGSVKPALVVLVGDAQADLAAYFHAQRVSLDERAAAHAPPVEVCQHGGE